MSFHIIFDILMLLRNRVTPVSRAQLRMGNPRHKALPIASRHRFWVFRQSGSRRRPEVESLSAVQS
eukprot:4300802-Amphidinium_carterae.1